MSEEFENPVIPPDSEEARILAEMEAFDKEPVNVDLGPAYAATKAAQEKEMAARAKAEAPEQKAESLEQKAEEKPELSETDDQKAESDRPRDEKGRFLPKEETEKADTPESKEKAGEPEPIGDTTKPDLAKSDSAYEKAKKEAARKEKTWQQIQAEKAQVRAEAARLKTERETWEKVVAQRQPQTRPRDEHGNEIYSSQEYRNAAKQFRRDGEHEMADKAEVAAEQAQVREQHTAQQRFAEHQRDMAFKVMDAEPELANQESPLAKELQSVFQQEMERAKQYQRPSIFQSALDGFGMAVEVAKLRMKATMAEKLTDELKAARAEIQRLNSLVNVNASSPTHPPRAKTFEDMSADEQLEYMDRQARAAGQNFFVPQR